MTMAPGAFALGEGLPKLEVKTENGRLRLYGQINLGVLNYDDGYQNETYAPVDNNNSSSRFGVTYDHKLSDWAFQARFEAEYKPYSSNNINITDDQPIWRFDRTNIRKLEVTFGNDDYGMLWLGQGSMASDNSAEVDLSGTKIAAYSLVSDTAGGQLFRNEANSAAFGPAVKSAFNNYDGLSRKLRVRYDTPKLYGFRLQSSFGNDELVNQSNTKFWDIAATFDSDKMFGDFLVNGAIAYGEQEQNEGVAQVTTFAGSMSILHGPTGLNFTFAAGERDNGSRTGQYAYGKLGLLRDYVEAGPTALAVDYYSGTDIAAIDTDSQSVGFGVVQTITDWNLDLWATYRSYAYDSPTADFEDGRAIFAGARFSF